MYQVFYVYIIATGLMFLLDSWLWEWENLWLFCLLLGIFSCWVDMIAFASSYYILFCCVWLSSFRSLFFSNERWKGRVSREEENWRKNKRNRGRGNYNQETITWENNLFLIKENHEKYFYLKKNHGLLSDHSFHLPSSS